MASTCTSQWLLDSLRILVSDLNASAEVTLEAAEEYMTRIELLYREMLATEIERGVLTENEVEVLLNLSRAYDSMSQLVDRMSSVSDCTEGPVVHCGRVGRPAFLIPQEQLQCLIEFRFSVPQIAQLLGVSVRTVRHRMSVAGLSIRSTYSQFSWTTLLVVFSNNSPTVAIAKCLGTLLLGECEFSTIELESHSVELILREVFSDN